MMLQVLQATEERRGIINLTPHGIEFANFEGVWRYANMMERGGILPKGVNKEMACISILVGRRAGLDPMESVHSIAIVNGRPMIWGDAPLILARASAFWVEEKFREWFTLDGKE